jgi:hypothetical protein
MRENFFIVLYDEVREAVRFLYFADALDPYVAEPDVEIPLDEVPNSLTMALAAPRPAAARAVGPLRATCNVPVDLTHGPDRRLARRADAPRQPCQRRDRGAELRPPAMYSDEDRALLELRRPAHPDRARPQARAGELERRVYERTHALQQANLVLQAEIVERKRAERLQRALFQDHRAVGHGRQPRALLCRSARTVVGELLYARNFYIALLTPDGEQIEFPYSVDERDPNRVRRKFGMG